MNGTDIIFSALSSQPENLQIELQAQQQNEYDKEIFRRRIDFKNKNKKSKYQQFHNKINNKYKYSKKFQVINQLRLRQQK